MFFKCWIVGIEGMSDLRMYQLEDSVWDEICQSDDHIVPHPGDKYAYENTFQGDNHKKPRHEVIGVSSNAGERYAAKYVSEGKDEGHFPTLKNQSSRVSSHCFKSSNLDPIGSEVRTDDLTIGERCAAVDNNTTHYRLDQTDNNFGFFDNNIEDKQSSDLLYYGWPELENFEDVDRMFRSCDSAFGPGGVGNEDDIGWFSSSQMIEGSEDVLKSDFEISCTESSPSKYIQERHEPSKVNNTSSSINCSNIENMSVSFKEDDEVAAVGQLSFSDAISDIKDESVLKEQINLQKKQTKHEYQSEGKREGRCLENGVSYHHTNNPQFKNMKLPSTISYPQVFPSQQMQPDPFGYLQTHSPYVHSGYNHPSDQNSVSPILSVIRSENSGQISISPRESSCASNQMQPMESSHGNFFETTDTTMDEKQGKLHLQHGFQTSFTSDKKHDLTVQVHHYDNKVENQSEGEAVSMGMQAKVDSSNVQESSCMSSGLNEISQEATSFCQLRHIMEKLDIRTKLCIRDSLYRLARSAEQRNYHANLKGGCRDDVETSGALMDEGTDDGLMDIETETNPIDRSMAHLLFHRPSDSSVIPANDVLSLKPHTVIHESNTSPPLMAEKRVCQEENVSEGDIKVADHRQ